MSRSPSIQPHLLPYCSRLEKRAPREVLWVVIHCTELPDMATAREYGEKIHHDDTRTGNCGHFYIDRDGRIEQYVPLDRVAHHVAGQNRHSVGIELVNLGRFPHWYHSTHQHMNEAYPPAQIDALIDLLDWLQIQLPALTQIAGHEQLDQRTIPAADNPEVSIRRKMDPGPLFPWPQVLKRTPLKLLSAEQVDESLPR